MIKPAFELFLQKAKEGNLVPVYQEILADTETPVSTFLKIRKAAGSHLYLLESVVGGEKWGRYSFLGMNPSLVMKADRNQVEVIEKGKTQDRSERFRGNPLEILKGILARFRPVQSEDLPRFSGGAVGFVGYEQDLFFIIADTLFIFDNLKHTIKIVSYAFLETGEEDLQETYETAVAKIEGCMAHLTTPVPLSPVTLWDRGPEAAGEEPKGASPPVSNMTREAFKNAVQTAKEHIARGDIFQVQISQRFSTPLHGDPFAVYRALRGINPSPYMYYLQFGALHLVGSSPEVLVRLEGREAETRPIAGTRRRGRTLQEDKALEQELLSDPKERAEHIMLVDLGRNDLGRVCQYGSIQVTELMIIERYSHVMHLVSNVAGRLRPECDAFALFEACFPAGTVTGAPKIRAMQIIEQLEPVQRGPYAGAVGYFGFDGNMDTCITIRTIVIEDTIATVQAAAGIVADSDPDREYQETLNKAQALLAAIAVVQKGWLSDDSRH